MPTSLGSSISATAVSTFLCVLCCEEQVDWWHQSLNALDASITLRHPCDALHGIASRDDDDVYYHIGERLRPVIVCRLY